MSNWAKPGVKCVCVDAEMGDGDPPVLVVGGVYTVRKVIAEPLPLCGPYAGSMWSLQIVEVNNPYHRRHGSFAVGRFRPLITRTQEQDVALIKSLLNKVVAPVHA